jgi:hypothetical protein
MPEMSPEDRAVYLASAPNSLLIDIAAEFSETRRPPELDARLAVITELLIRVASGVVKT